MSSDLCGATFPIYLKAAVSSSEGHGIVRPLPRILKPYFTRIYNSEQQELCSRVDTGNRSPSNAWPND